MVLLQHLISTDIPIECYFDDNLFFKVNEKEEDDKQAIVVKDDVGKHQAYRRYSQTPGLTTTHTSTTTTNMEQRYYMNMGNNSRTRP